MASATFTLVGVDQVTPAAASAEASLGTLGQRASSVGTLLAGATVAGAVALGGALVGVVSAAAGFERQMSAVSAVSGATGAQMQSLTALALQLGKDTSFSAQEAAVGIEELAKAGLSVTQIMGGAGRAALDLAAAGAVSVGEAATIASNAMNAFNIPGEQMAHVADMIAGAAIASAIDVHEFGFSLSAAGAVAHTMGIDFDDLTVAIAAMGNAGIKGSDAGTSLKTMMLNLSPSTNAARDAMKDLGLETTNLQAGIDDLSKRGIQVATQDWVGLNNAFADWKGISRDHGTWTAKNRTEYEKWAFSTGLLSSAFFDASGKVKSFRDISEILKTSLEGLTQQQQINAIKTIFGTDAIRSAAILAELGAEKYDELAAAIGKTTAMDVANERLNNLSGSMEKLKGSLETGAIMLGSMLTPALKGFADQATESVNQAIEVIGQLPDAWAAVVTRFNGGDMASSLAGVMTLVNVFGADFAASIMDAVRQAGDAWRTVGSIFSGDEWHPADIVDPFVNAVGMIAVFTRDQLLPAFQAAATFITGTLAPAFMAAADFLAAHTEIIVGVVAAWATFTIVSTVAGWITAAIATWGALSGAITAAGGVIGAIVAVMGGPLTLAILAVAAVAGVLTAAWIGNWGDIQGKTAAAVEFISGVFNDTLVPAFNTIVEVTSTTAAAFATWAVDTYTSVATWATDTYTAITDWVSTTTETVSGWATATTTTFDTTWATIQTAATTAWTTLGDAFTTGTATLNTIWTTGWAALGAVQTAAWNLITPENQTKILELQQAFTDLWTVAGQLWAAGTAAIAAQVTIWWGQLTVLWTTSTAALSTLVTGWWATLTTLWTTSSATVTATTTTWWAAIEALWTTTTATITTTVTGWWSSLQTLWETSTAALTASLTAALAPWVELFTTTMASISATINSAAATLAADATALGAGIVAGIIGGINAAIGGIADALTRGVRGAIGAAQSLLPGGGGGGGRAPENYRATTTGGFADNDERIAYLREGATRRGHDPNVTETVGRSEGAGPAGPVGDGGQSFGALQAFTGGGQGNQFQAETGLDPRNPNNEKALIDWQLDRLPQTGWQPFHGAQAAGISNRQGINVAPSQPSPGQMNRLPLTGPGAAPMGGTTGIGNWTPQDMQGIIDLGPPWEQTMQAVQTSAETAFTGISTASTDALGNTTTIFTDAGGTMTAVITNAAGEIVNQFGTMAAGTTEQAGAMNVGVSEAVSGMVSANLTSVTDLGTGTLTVTTDMAGQTIATITDMQGNVTSQYSTMQANGAASAQLLQTNVIDAATIANAEASNQAQLTDVNVSSSLGAMQVAGTGSAQLLQANVIDAATIGQAEASNQAQLMDTNVTTAAAAMNTDASGSADEMASNLEGSFGTVVEAADSVPEPMGAAATSVKAVGKAADDATSPLEDFASAAQAAGEVEIDTSDYVKNLDKIAASAKKATKALDELKSAAENVTESQGGSQGGKAGSGGKGGGKAGGGPVMADTAYLVGERGPELFMPSSAGYIVPHASLRDVGGRSSDIDYERLAAAIVAAQRDQAPNYTLNISTQADHEPIAADFAILEALARR